jgi:hypothetical protein
MWEPQRLTILWASTACYRDSFTFTLISGLTRHSVHWNYMSCCGILLKFHVHMEMFAFFNYMNFAWSFFFWGPKQWPVLAYAEFQYCIRGAWNLYKVVAQWGFSCPIRYAIQNRESAFCAPGRADVQSGTSSALYIILQCQRIISCTVTITSHIVWQYSTEYNIIRYEPITQQDTVAAAINRLVL